MSQLAYWDLSYQAGEAHGMRHSAEHDETYIEELESLLKESVRLRLRSDVPFGAFLSGGIDSSLVVALMSQFLSEPVKTFSVGYHGTGAEISELPYARKVAAHYQTEHHELFVAPQDFVDLAEHMAWHFDQPIADQPSLALYMLSRLASQHVKMVLTGEGGDELFAGYARHAGERFAPLFGFIPSPAKQLMLASSERLPGLRRPKQALYALCQKQEATRFTNWFALFNHDAKAGLLSESLHHALWDTSSDKVFAETLARTDATTALNRMLYVDTKLWLPDDLLARGDKMTMAASIEGRIPLLDHKLVEFAAALPPNLKLRGLKGKYLLKEVGRRHLPREIIERKKKGFPMPVDQWFRNEARSFVRDLLSPDVIQRRGLFDPTYVESLLDHHESGAGEHGTQIWALLNIELWHRLYIDTTTAISTAKPLPLTIQKPVAHSGNTHLEMEETLTLA